MRHVKKFKNPKPRRRSLTDKQKQALWAELEKDAVLLRIVVLALNLPLRRGQILAIEPHHCDFENRILLAAPSKGKDVREVPMNETVVCTLQSMIQDAQLPLPFQRFEKRWHAALIEAKINEEHGTRDDNFHFHDLRHVFGSDLIKSGVNPYVVKELFGHSDMRTSSIYMTADRSDLAEAVRRLDVQEIGGIN
jgi:integrase